MNEICYSPLSLEQERAWLLARSRGAAPVLHERGAAWLDGELDVPRLARAIERVAARQTILRTSFTEHDGQPAQAVSPQAEIALREVDLGAEGWPASDESALAMARREASLPLDLERGPLWRVSLIRVHSRRHLIALTMHPILSDGEPSAALFFSELFDGYHGVERPAPPARYQDHARRQRERTTAERIDRQLAHWRRELSGAPEALEIRTDRPRPAARTFAGGSAERALDQALVRELRALGREEDVALSAVLLAGLLAVLHRHTGQDDVLLGVPLSGRDDGETDGLIGPFGNLVVVRGRLGADPSFRSLLRQVRRSMQEGNENGEISLSSLVEQLSLPRDPSRAPLVQATFSSGSGTLEPRRGPLLTLTPAALEATEVAFELAARVEETEASVIARVDFNRDLFERATIERLLGHWAVLLRGAAGDPEQRVSALPLLTDEERRTLLFAWNSGGAFDPPRDRLHERVEAHARRTPSAVAVTFEGQRLTYAELDRRSNQIAHLLRGSGAGPDVPIGVCLERSLEMIVALLGVLKSGGAYVPLDPSHPAERLAFLLEDTGVPVILTEERFASRLRSGSARVVCLDADRSVIERQPEDRVRPAPDEGPEDLAYIIYTSGSTGKPKGVMVSHANVARLFDHTAIDVGYSDRDVWTLFHSYAFDFSVLEIWGALCHGGRLVVVPFLTSRTPDAFHRLLGDEGVTVVCQTPAALRQLIHADAAAEPSLGGRLQLRLVICGGEALDVAMLKPWWDRHGDRRPTILNIYGPTETTVFATRRAMGIPDLERPWSSSIGSACRDVQVLLLDRNRALVPVGVAGEIYIGGAGVSRGYLNRPELTQERFVESPFGGGPGSRLYRTGDLARYLPSGEIEFLGRIDDQVKIHGHRIELGEIAAALGQHPSVREVAVVAREDAPGDRRLVAYVVPRAARGASAGDEQALLPALRALAQRHLPSYMVPSAFVPLDALPTSPNGKVDRRALPAPGGARLELGRAFVAPRSELEEALAVLWQEILRVERVGVHDSFFELGGSSLHAVQLFSRLRGAFGIDVGFQELFDHPTVAGLAALRKGGARAAPREEHAIPRGTRTGPAPLSFAQERMWFLHRLAPESRAYNCLCPFRLTGDIHVAALDRSLRELVRRHEILRTVYTEIDGHPAQIVAEDASFRLDVADLQHLSEEEREPRAEQLLDAEAQRIFDLKRGPVFRAGLLRLGPRDHVLWLHLHHIAVDGWSLEVAYREIAALYDAFRRDAPPLLPDAPLQYADFASWQREQLTDERLSDLLAGWKQRLLDVPPLLELPGDRVRPPVQTFRGATIPFQLAPEVGRAIRDLGAREGVTVNMVLLAAFAVLLHRITQRDDILVGLPSAGRDHAEIEAAIGFFVNVVPIRIDVSGEPSFAELLRRVRGVCLDAYAHDRLPFERLVQELQPVRDPSYSPLVQIVFAPQPPAERELHLPGVEARAIDTDTKKTIFDVSLYAWESAGGVAGMLEYSTDLFERATMDRMMSHLFALLAAATSDPALSVSSMPLLPERERRRLLVEWNDTGADFPRDLCVLDLFEEQAARAPDAAAVVSDRGSLTYGELDRRANQLARRLRELCVAPEPLVAICAERSLEMVVGILGALKAGAAYLPVDAEIARERLAFILEDSGAPVLLTQAHLADRLPPFAGTVIRLDADGPALAARDGSPLPACAGPGNLAYAIYTSGSTGRPKGVLVEHRSLMNLVAWHVRRFAVSSADRATLVASPGFDASVWELWPYLCVGACLFIPGEPLRRSPDELKAWLLARGITVSFLPTPMAEELLRLDWPASAALRYLLTGGDKLRVWPDAALPFEVVNNYGPTEATVVATSCLVPRARPNGGTATGDPSIGRPIDNMRAYLLDPRGELVPVGVPGELYVGGAGVARGYLNRPELDQARFLPDRFSGEPGARMYRTGDRARWLPDGSIEFLGRVDNQVKIRGYRIELGEIEAVLREHPDVEEAVVVAREDTPGNKRLVAYVIPRLGDGAATERAPALQAEHVSAWQALYDGTYGRGGAVEDPGFNITGWNSSYTGGPIDAGAMRAWRDHTVERILSFQPRRVWEIGCGTGLLLLQLAPQCAAYLGTDFSEKAISLLAPELARGTLSHVSLQRREANDFSGVEPGSFDVIVLNSIVQYFPGADYLRSVIEGAVRAVAPGGVVFLGDIRSLPLLEAFHTSVQLHRASPDAASAEVLARVRRAVDGEEELVLAPELFHALRGQIPGVEHVEVWLKRGSGADEMTRFRYDVVLHVGAAPEPVAVGRSLDWAAAEGLAGVERAVREEGSLGLEVLGIPNARVHADVIAALRLRQGGGAELTRAVTAAAGGAMAAIEPEVLWALGARLGCSVRITASRTAGPGCMDVLFERTGRAPRPRAWTQARPGETSPDRPLANSPLRRQKTRAMPAGLRELAAARLPDYMVPAAFVKLDALPLTANGKVDMAALPADDRRARPEPRAAAPAPASNVEVILGEIWREVLGVDEVGLDDPFFELGGHSLLLARVRAGIRARLGEDVPIMDLFQYPTIRSLSGHLKRGPLTASSGEGAASRRRPGAAAPAAEAPAREALPETAIAIVGMAGRFPKARSVDALWSLLEDGGEGISFYSSDELRALGVESELYRSPGFIPAAGLLEDVMCFDAAFFGYSREDAVLMDPQQRVFLECAWEAMENAGYNPLAYPKSIGVFAGSDAPSYWIERVGPPPAAPNSEHQRIYTGNVTDSLTTRVAYKLGLRGPAVSVMTACSTSLVAVHLGCQSLLTGESDMVLAGGIGVLSPRRIGYLHAEGSVTSPDGHCRPFDAEASGIVASNGVGIVVLKRLKDAIDDGDTIHAVIRGSAVTNDGALKVGYMAPSLEGQMETIARAHAAAGVSPESITYVEAHGAGTRLGDSIEVAALSRAFRRATDRVGYCALGSVKSNLGHLRAAAGVTGLIKAALALEHELIPATLHFRRPSPEIDLASSPFFVNAGPRAWKRGGAPRRAAVSAFGIGGTNAHAVIEEAPETPPSGPSRRCQLLVVSARTRAALEQSTDRLAEHLRRAPRGSLPDAAFTLQRGRVPFAHRRAVVCADPAAGAASLDQRDPARVFTHVAGRRPPEVVFMFPGAGAEHVGMGRELYLRERAYRESMDRCADRFRRELSGDFRDQLFPEAQGRALGEEPIACPRLRAAALFSTEYALAQLLMSWGIRPAAVLGHGVGEIAALCIAGVLSLDDAIALVALRGRAESESEAEAVEPLLARMLQRAASMARRAPSIPVACGLAGDWVTETDVQDPSTWARLLTGSARPDDRIARLLASADRALLEVGPGASLAALASRHPGAWGRPIASTLPGPGEGAGDLEALLAAVGQLWCAGVDVDWAAFSRDERRRRVPLPTYPFERALHTLDTTCTVGPATTRSLSPRIWGPPGSSGPSTGSPASVRSREAAAQQGDRVTQALSSAVRELFGVKSVRPSDSMLDLGGSSLSFMKLRAQLEARLNVDLPVRVFYEARTFAALAERVREALPPDSHAPLSAALTQRSGSAALLTGGRAAGQLLVTLRAGAPDATPLFLIPPLGGTVQLYHPLAQRLSGELPVFGVQPVGAAPSEPGSTTIPAIAGRYVDEILSARPEGSYLLGGHSAGGVVAYEVAQQLLAQGRKVPLLLLLDTGCIPRSSDRSPASALAQEMAEIEAIASQRYRGFVAAMEDDARLRAEVMSTWQALSSYEPRPTEASVLYLRAREQIHPEDGRAVSAWMDLARASFALQAVPGDHFTMMEPPHVAHVARVIQQHIAGATRPALLDALEGRALRRSRARSPGAESGPESGPPSH
ncbi:amino acid adenylation domain-containing protein [Sorangium sp. So ce260]|uniref:amino acid adenylation domain-containing protein n=1 Tax=Sorangium sp. So ce260 TaxID=3133291 RepID=UPI003F6427C2